MLIVLTLPGNYNINVHNVNSAKELYFVYTLSENYDNHFILP